MKGIIFAECSGFFCSMFRGPLQMSFIFEWDEHHSPSQSSQQPPPSQLLRILSIRISFQELSLRMIFSRI